MNMPLCAGFLFIFNNCKDTRCTTSRMEEVESRLEQRSRATQEHAET